MIRILLLLLLLSLPFSSGLAVEVDVYSGEVTVPDQGSAERRQALPRALDHVFRKYSGQRQLEPDPNLDAVLESASAILVSFYYQNAERTLADGSTEEELRLVAKFSPPEVDELARGLNLPLWQAELNPLEVWVVVDDGRQRQVLPVEIEYVKESLNATARDQGQPLTWPVPDEEGMYSVDMQLLWGGYTEDLASLHGAGVLILAARREGLEWGVRANLGFGGEHWAWRVQDRDLEAALLEGLQLAVDRVASGSAIAASDLGISSYELTVTGLNSAADYQGCLAYLGEIGIVEGVSVLSAKPAAVTFRLDLNAMPQYLEDAFVGDGMLEPGEADNEFVYKGNGRP